MNNNINLNATLLSGITNKVWIILIMTSLMCSCQEKEQKSSKPWAQRMADLEINKETGVTLSISLGLNHNSGLVEMAKG